MPEPLADALTALRPLLLDSDGLVRAVAAGRRRGQHPSWQRVVLRPVDLKSGRCLQVVTEDGQGPRTRNEAYDGAADGDASRDGQGAARAVDDLLAEPFGNWHVETTTETVQLRVTKKGEAQVHRTVAAAAQHTGHDRAKPHLIDPGDPLFKVLGAGAAKRRQVDAFLHMLVGVLDEARLSDDRPLRVVDLGCGNAYLTFAAYRFLSERRPVEVIGVDLRPQARERNTALAAELGWSEHMRFEEGRIVDAAVMNTPDGNTPDGGTVDVVLSLHACDTATDDALAQAVRWQAPVILASPCCHHDLQRQLKAAPTPAPYALLTRHAILRERFGDALTDALRASLLRRVGYRADVVQFVASEYTPRNTMIKAVRTDRPEPDDAQREYDDLVAGWGVTPYLQTLLADALR
jgi:SAM-dependent methyltransferase